MPTESNEASGAGVQPPKAHWNLQPLHAETRHPVEVPFARGSNQHGEPQVNGRRRHRQVVRRNDSTGATEFGEEKRPSPGDGGVEVDDRHAGGESIESSATRRRPRRTFETWNPDPFRAPWLALVCGAPVPGDSRMREHSALRRVGRFAAVTALGSLCAGAVAGAQPARVETVAFHSAAVDRTMQYDIVLPPGYDDPANADRRYPTLYLLHGEGRSFLAWREILDGAADAGGHEMILVMPDAGESFYVNWARTDDGRRDAWEGYLVEDVVGHVDTHYRTVAEREGRAIAGFGMGGYGALTVGLRNPDRVVSVGSQSGMIDYARLAAERLRLGGDANPPRGFTAEAEARRRAEDPRIGLAGFRSTVDRTPRGQPFVTAAEAESHDPFLLVMRVRRNALPFLQIDSPTAGPYLVTAQAFAEMLIDADIPFDYTQRRGRHDTAYWREAYRYALAVHYETMRQALNRPEP